MVALRRSMATGQGLSSNPRVDLDSELDAVIIGAGFAGVHLLWRLRQEGFKVKLVEAGSGLGGVWHWSNYPGARVDSEYPVYQLSIPELYTTFPWKEHYPSADELQSYFRHVDAVLGISSDTLYNTRVSAATWDDAEHKWRVECDNGLHITTRFLHCCMGFAAKRNFPDWPGLDEFEGYIQHSSFWPAEGVDLEGKNMGVIGNGATGIQIAQTAARSARKLAVYIRTPNTAIPMNQRPIDQQKAKLHLPQVGDKLCKERYTNGGGYLFWGRDKNLFDDPPEVRDKVINEALDQGGFRVLFTYDDLDTNPKANRYLYDILNRRTRARITDPKKRDILAPVEPPHPVGGKRPSMEMDYYEQMDKDHVEIVDLKSNPISHFVAEGIVTEDGTLHKHDVIAVATGFDNFTGGFMDIDFTGVDGEKLRDKWSGERGALSYLGMSVHGFPNMFYLYGPQAPSSLGNGPSVVQPQGDWVTEVMTRMRTEGRTRINAQEEAEDNWKQWTETLSGQTLRHYVDSPYFGSNIPGKPRQALNFCGGLPLYLKAIREALDDNYRGFDVS